MDAATPAAVVRAYHTAWTSKDFDRAAGLLAEDLRVEVPINNYPTAESFAAAVKGFGSLTTTVDLLAAMSAGNEAMLLYDMDVQGLGILRVAEHFTVDDGKITRIRQIHDTAPVRAAGFAGAEVVPTSNSRRAMQPALPSDLAPDSANGYRRRLAIQAPRQVVFDAIATVEGPRHWWTTIVTGSAAAGGQLTFAFAGLDEKIIMHVDTVEPPSLVRWSCTAHTRGDEWTGSSLRFELAARGTRACELDFRHQGLAADLVADGWDHFLTSLVAHCEHGRGTPFGPDDTSA